MHDPKEIRVALLQGGNSSEREISLHSGKGAYKALSEAGYDVEMIDPADISDLKRLMTGPFDVAFICLHGEKGEDGCIQGFLEMIGLPYTCSGVASSSYCMDKVATKRFYRSAGIPTPASMEISCPDVICKESISVLADEIQHKIGTDCVVKVPNGGSSIGVYITSGIDPLKDALHDVFEQSRIALVEQYVSGREVTNVVLEQVKRESEPSNKTQFETVALPIIEIIPSNDSYDYDSKYLPGGSKHICPAELSPEVTANVQKMAVLAHETLNCSGVSRTDFIIDDDNQAWALETNTVPGMTETSLLPDAARAAGYSFSELCVMLIENALMR